MNTQRIVDDLVRLRDEAEYETVFWKAKIDAINFEIFRIVGNCPLCKNAHYPFCR